MRSATRCSPQAIVSANVFRLASSLPSRYHWRPSSPPPRGWASAQTNPRSSSDRRATREPRRHRGLVRAVAVEHTRRRASSGVSTWRTMSRGTSCRRRRWPTAVGPDTASRSTFGVGIRRSNVRSPVATSSSYSVVGVVSDWTVNRNRFVSHCGFAAGSTSWGSAPRSSTRSVQIAEQHAQPRLGVGPLVDHEVCRERLDAENPSARLVGDELGPTRRSRRSAPTGAINSRKSTASSFVCMTNRSPQWSMPYSTSVPPFGTTTASSVGRSVDSEQGLGCSFGSPSGSRSTPRSGSSRRRRRTARRCRRTRRRRRLRRADPVAPHGRRALLGVGRHVEDPLAVARPRDPRVRGVVELDRRGPAGGEVADPQRVVLVAGDVRRPCREAVIHRHVERAEVEVVVTVPPRCSRRAARPRWRRSAVGPRWWIG